jgi:hypothetical protein
MTRRNIGHPNRREIKKAINTTKQKCWFISRQNNKEKTPKNGGSHGMSLAVRECGRLRVLYFSFELYPLAGF